MVIEAMISKMSVYNLIWSQIRQQFSNKTVILYDRFLNTENNKNKSNTLWNINLNVPARSMKGILMLFEDPSRISTEDFYNPKITKVEMTIKGIPIQLYSQGLQAYQQRDEIKKKRLCNDIKTR